MRHVIVFTVGLIVGMIAVAFMAEGAMRRIERENERLIIENQRVVLDNLEMQSQVRFLKSLCYGREAKDGK
jgi:hypothetical protein